MAIKPPALRHATALPAWRMLPLPRRGFAVRRKCCRWEEIKRKPPKIGVAQSLPGAAVWLTSCCTGPSAGTPALLILQDLLLFL